MKLIIEIPEYVYNNIKEYYETHETIEATYSYIYHGTPLTESDDCVSRKAVNKLVDELARAISDERCCMSRGRSTATIMQDILDLSSVQPKRDKGDKE